MSTTNMPSRPSNSNAEIMADLECVCRQIAGGGIIGDPELRRRIEMRSAKIRQEILDTHGIQDIGVSIIREMRGELRQP